MKRFLISLSFLLLLPGVLSAEEVKDGFIPALCKQVLSSENGTVREVVTQHVVRKVKELPKEVASVVVEKGNDLAGTLIETLDSLKKPEPLALASAAQSSDRESSVLGASTTAELGMFDSLYNQAIDGLAFLLRHWLWTLSTLAVALIAWSFRS